jgi:hypothetical protein
MQRIEINTHLDQFRMLDKIVFYAENIICGEKSYIDSENYLLLESLAQLAALHVRNNVNFEKHAFLLKVNHFELNCEGRLNGLYKLNCELTGHSNNGFLYSVNALSEKNDVLKGELLIGVIEYNSDFKTKDLKEYYKKVFRCLQTGLEKS